MPWSIDAIPVLFKTLAFGILGFAVVVALGAMGLRYAAKILRIGDIPFLLAFKCELIAKFTLVILSFAIGFNYGFVSGMSKPNNFERISLHFSPTFFLYQLIFGLIFSAMVLQHLLNHPQNWEQKSNVNMEPSVSKSINFRDSFLVSCFGSAIGATVVFLVGIIVIGIYLSLYAMFV